MRYFITFLIIFIILSCSNSTQVENSGHSANQTNQVSTSSDSVSWQDNFLKLYSAISNGDRKAIKMFIDFPIMNEGNEIWLLADSRLVMEMDHDQIKPFTEADFDKYFSAIFSLDLRKTLEKTDTAKFFKFLEDTSPEIEVVENSKSRLTVTFDKSMNKLTLLLLNTGRDFEFAVQYEFEYTAEKMFRFRHVRVAG